MKELFRFRNIFTLGGTLVIMAYLYISDPNEGGLTLPFLAKLATPVIAVFFAHWARKALFDYLDMGQLYRKAKETATGAGLAFLGLCIVIFGLLSLFGSQVYAQDIRTYVPPQAIQHLPTLKNEQERFWADHPKASYLAGQIEKESCITLKHARCWNPKVTLKTHREYGAGLGQLTKAYRTDGSIRFDALSEIKFKHKKELAELTWDNILERPDLQMRAVTLKMRDNYQYYEKYSYNITEAYLFAAVSYNGGIGGLDNERRACKLASWCDHTKWTDNVEKLCLKSKSPMYGTRSACDINRAYPKDVLYTRSPKYNKFWGI